MARVWCLSRYATQAWSPYKWHCDSVLRVTECIHLDSSLSYSTVSCPRMAWFSLFLVQHNGCFQQQNVVLFLKAYNVFWHYILLTWFAKSQLEMIAVDGKHTGQMGLLDSKPSLESGLHTHSKFCNVSHLICNVHSKSLEHKKCHIKPVMAYDAGYKVCWLSPQFWKFFICNKLLWFICHLAPFSLHTFVLFIAYIRWLSQAWKSKNRVFQ